MEEPILVYQKNIERNTCKIMIPRAIVKKMGRQVYMKIYKDKIVLVPVKEGE